MKNSLVIDRIFDESDGAAAFARLVAQLRQEAGAAGDHEMVLICGKALMGDVQAKRECARVINEAIAAAAEVEE